MGLKSNSNSLVTLTSSSTITTIPVSPVSAILDINPAPAMSVTVTGQDHYFGSRLNAMENSIFKLLSTLEKFISASEPSGKSRGENGRGYLTKTSVNASQSEIDQLSDNESNYAHLLERNPARILSILILFKACI